MRMNIEFGGDAVTRIGTAPAHHAIGVEVRAVFHPLRHFATSLRPASVGRGRRPGRGRSTSLEHVPKKLLDFFDKDMLQLFESERFLFDHVIPRDREAL